MTLKEQLISAPDAGKILGLTAVRVGVLCRQGRFNGAEKIGRNWVIPREAVENFKRLPPGGRRNIKYQTEEDKALMTSALMADEERRKEETQQEELEKRKERTQREPMDIWAARDAEIIRILDEGVKAGVITEAERQEILKEEDIEI